MAVLMRLRGAGGEALAIVVGLNKGLGIIAGVKKGLGIIVGGGSQYYGEFLSGWLLLWLGLGWQAPSLFLSFQLFCLLISIDSQKITRCEFHIQNSTRDVADPGSIHWFQSLSIGRRMKVSG